MMNSNPFVEDNNPDYRDIDYGPLININISHGSNNFEFHLPARANFGHLKQKLQQNIGLDPQQQKILFRGQEKDDGEYLHEAGVKDKSKVLVLEHPVGDKQQSKEMNKSEGASKVEVQGTDEMLNLGLKGSEASTAKMKEQEEMSKAFAAIAAVRAEVDKLAERVAALEVAVNGGIKVEDQELVIPTELLMRQLLKLDTIDTEGEARIQRKNEVRRIQNFHELLDNLKAKNSKPISDNSNTVVTTEWATFDSIHETTTSPSSSSTKITQEWEKFD